MRADDISADKNISLDMKTISIHLIFATILLSCSSTQEKFGDPYQNGQISSKYTVTSDGLKNGPYVTFYENGQKRSEGNYEGNKQVGYWITWHDNGNKSSEGSFENGLQTGEWKFYYSDGKLQQINHFKNDKSEGIFIDFDKNGIKRREGVSVNGLLNGKSIEYFPDGKVSSELTYVDHRPTGPFIEYYPDGKLRAKGTWRDSALVGEYFVFDSLDNSSYVKQFVLADGNPSDTDFIYKNNKLTQYKIYDKKGNERIVNTK
ncbi:MAG: toxin-antitoxin system YwqK family antitoxin [Bacteroidia bacterium]|nr:toxin-antitoxin system YwqK family antitoxin [Bacteroidia bacterium]